MEAEHRSSLDCDRLFIAARATGNHNSLSLIFLWEMREASFQGCPSRIALEGNPYLLWLLHEQPDPAGSCGICTGSRPIGGQPGNYDGVAPPCRGSPFTYQPSLCECSLFGVCRSISNWMETKSSRDASTSSLACPSSHVLSLAMKVIVQKDWCHLHCISMAFIFYVMWTFIFWEKLTSHVVFINFFLFFFATNGCFIPLKLYSLILRAMRLGSFFWLHSEGGMNSGWYIFGGNHSHLLGKGLWCQKKEPHYESMWSYQLWATLNCAFRWTHTNLSTFHAIQILIVIVKKLM
jgi:hypothetical protein